jgi:hypothetical protein
MCHQRSNLHAAGRKKRHRLVRNGPELSGSIQNMENDFKACCCFGLGPSYSFPL